MKKNVREWYMKTYNNGYHAPVTLLSIKKIGDCNNCHHAKWSLSSSLAIIIIHRRLATQEKHASHQHTRVIWDIYNNTTITTTRLGLVALLPPSSFPSARITGYLGFFRQGFPEYLGQFFLLGTQFPTRLPSSAGVRVSTNKCQWGFMSWWDRFA